MTPPVSEQTNLECGTSYRADRFPQQVNSIKSGGVEEGNATLD